MEKLERQEIIWGGILGIIGILAAIVELFLNGLSAASIAGALKDIAGTAVVVILLISFVKSLPKTLKRPEEILERAVENWGADNAPLIFKTEGYVRAKDSKYCQGFVLLQDPKCFITLANSNLNKESPEWARYAQYGNGRLTGKFLDMPSYLDMTSGKFDVLFVMEQQHFKNKDGIQELIQDIVEAVNLRYSEKIRSARIGNSLKFTLSVNKIETEKDIELFVDSLDFVLSLVKVIA